MVIPNTGGWQNWQTVTGRVITLESGTYTMRVEAASGSIISIGSVLLPLKLC